MKNKLKVFGVATFISMTTLNFSQAQNSLIIRMHDGTQAGSIVSSLDKITFSGSTMIVKKTDTTLSSYLLSDIQRMTFGIYSDISTVKADPNELTIYPNPATKYILLKNAPEGVLTIVVYGLDGIELIHKKLMSGMQQIDISDLAKGLYLLKVNEKTFKFRKQ